MALSLVAVLSTIVAVVVLQIALYRSAAPQLLRVRSAESRPGRSRGRLHQF